MYGRKEGLVVGSSVDYAVSTGVLSLPLLFPSFSSIDTHKSHLSQGRQVVEIQFEPGEVYKTWYPNVRRVRRTVSYSSPAKHRTVERTVYW